MTDSSRGAIPVADPVEAGELDALSAAPALSDPGSAFRATALLGGSSLISILITLVVSKAWALLVGPAGLGQFALLQSLSGLFALAAGLGVGTGLVRLGAAAVVRGELGEVQALRSAAWRLVWIVWGVGTVLLALFARPVSRVMLGTHDQALTAVVMGFAALATIAAGLFIGILNAHHRVTTIAKVSVLTTALSGVAAIGVLAAGRAAAIPYAVVASALAACLVAWWYVPPATAGVTVTPARRQQAFRELLRFGGPYTASMLLGAGVQFVMPAIVLHVLGSEQVGFYRAALGISSSYLAVLVTAFARDYYPRVSAAKDDPARLKTLLDEQHRLVMYLAAPMCLAFQAGASLLVPLVYSSAFAPTVRILQWLLVGELFRFSSYTLAHIILARSRSSRYLLTEAISGACLIGFSAIGMRLWGVTGLGVGYAAMYAVYFVVVTVMTRVEIAATLSRANVRLLGWSVVASLAVAVIGMTAPRTVQLVAGGAISLAAGWVALHALRHDVAGFRRHVTARFQRAAPPVGR